MAFKIWTRVETNGNTTYINGWTGTEYDAKGFNYWGFNAQGVDAIGTLGEDDDWYGGCYDED